MSQEEGQNKGIDLEDFLEFYLLDSQEQVDRLGSGLLQLEKDGENIGLVNELFRSAHSLKGASGTMGFTPIVELTHTAEDLLDKLRQGKVGVTNEIIDVLLAVTDKVKMMLSQVEQHIDITVDYAVLKDQMKVLAETGALAQTVFLEAEGIRRYEQDDTNYELAKQFTKEFTDEFTEEFNKEEKQIQRVIDFALTPFELGTIEEALIKGKTVYQVEVLLAPSTLMKAVRAVMVIQKLEQIGNVVKILPTIDDLEADTSETFHLLLVTTESPEEVRADILEISEILEAYLSHYSLSEADCKQKGIGQALNSYSEFFSDNNSISNNNNNSNSNSNSNSGSSSNSNNGGNSSDNSKVNSKSTISNINNKNTTNLSNGGTNSNSAKPSDQAQDNGQNQVHTIRVDTQRMDNLINLVGEMVITRTRLVKIGNDLKEQNQADPLVGSLNETNVYLGRLMSDLQESVMKLRMVPIGTVFSRYPRLVRDFCRKTGKKIELVIKGEETELDKTVIEMIGDPLTHIIRNSVDHGIEEPKSRIAAGKSEVGTITLDAYHEGNHIAITVTDDGAGLNIQKIYQKALEKGLISEREEISEKDIANLIFLPGFSTADQISDISGRGVGMDVVKKALNSLGGIVDIKTKLGEGTSFIIRLPLTLAIIQALLVEVGKEMYAVPLASVVETLLVRTSEIKTVGRLPMVQIRGNTLPLISLKQKFDLPELDQEKEEVFVVVVGLGDKALGLIVDELHGQEEIVIKTLGDSLNGLPGIAGATILGDGKVTLILDIGSLIQDVLITQ